MKPYSFILLASCLIFKASHSQIPNNDFEAWTNVGGWYENPEAWQTNNTQILISEVLKDADAYSGNFAARLTNYTPLVPLLYTYFSISAHPAHLNFYVKVSVSGNDSVWARAVLFQSGNAIDSGRWSVYEDISTYTFISMPLSNSVSNADSAIIEFYGGTQYGTEIKIDQLEFDYDFNNIVDPADELHVSAIQNPFQDLLQLNISSSTHGSYDIQLFDATGKLQLSGTGIQTSQKPVDIDASALPGGIYICTIRNNNGFNAIKLLKL